MLIFFVLLRWDKQLKMCKLKGVRTPVNSKKTGKITQDHILKTKWLIWRQPCTSIPAYFFVLSWKKIKRLYAKLYIATNTGLKDEKELNLNVKARQNFGVLLYLSTVFKN